MSFVSRSLSGALSVCTVWVLLMVPVTATSHSCLQGHAPSKANISLQISSDEPVNSSTIERHRNELLTALNQTEESARKLKKLIEKKHLQTKELIKECKKNLSLRGLPQIKSATVGAEEWVEVLSDDFRRLAITQEFVKAIVDTQKYANALGNLSTLMKKCLCYLETLSGFNHIELSYDVTPAVVPRMYKNMTDPALTDRRNCVVIRDVLNLIRDMRKVYKMKKTLKKV